MSTYQGQWPEKARYTEADVKVTVDGKPLPPAKSEVPDPGQTYGWGGFSTWAGKKLLAYSILLYELHNVMGVPSSTVHRYLLDIAELFMDDQVARFGKQWTLTSDEIHQWIQVKHPKTWEDLMSHRTPA